MFLIQNFNEKFSVIKMFVLEIVLQKNKVDNRNIWTIFKND